MTQSIQERIAASTYLTRLASQAKASVDELLRDDIATRLEELTDRARTTGVENAAAELRGIKAEFTLAWSVASLGSRLSLADLGRAQSRFADATIDSALRAAWHRPSIVPLTRDLPDASQPVPGLFVLGLGKLGGLDLNFSSDVDLIGYFDPDLVPVHPMQGKADVCSRVLKELTRLLSDSDEHGFVWRVDWRLRPDASVNPLAISAELAEEFYFFRSLPWHRLALLKARVIAGDIRCGQAFLNRIERYIWRANLDYRAIDELAALKKRINEEHPRLRNERETRQPIGESGRGVNLKLGSGCIREAEFVVNALQLIWGGKKPRLRETRTLDALDALVTEELVAEDDAKAIAGAYEFLRTHENYLQMIGNAQTYEVPRSDAEFERFLRLAGYEAAAPFERELYLHRRNVDALFSDLFHDDESADSCDIPVEWPEQISEASRRILLGWDEGFLNYGASRSQALQLRKLVPLLEQRLILSGVDIDRAIATVDRFLRRLPPGGQYLRLLLESPRLLDGLIEPLIYSPLMTRLLEQSPHLIDGLLEQEEGSNLGDAEEQAEFVLHSQDVETRLERIRRVLNEDLYRICLRFLNGTIDSRRFEEQHTELAERMLALAVRIVCDQLGIDKPPIAILGLGKLGMRAMAPESDIDLVFICGQAGELDLANRFASKLQTTIGARMREGRVFELDTRLRPSGRSGPPTVTLDSFRNYHLERARTWEHLALFPARCVAGDREIGQQAMAVRNEVLVRPRDRQQLVNDVVRMLWRLRTERIRPVEEGALQAKLRPGGLMEAEYLASALALQCAPEMPDLVELGYGEAVDKLAQSAGFDLLKQLEWWRSLQLWLRLLGLEEGSTADLPPHLEPRLFADLDLQDQLQLAQKLAEGAARTDTALRALVEQATLDPDNPDAWTEDPIRWV